MKRSQFEQPTPEQVTAYAASIGFKLDGEQFVDYYASCGWLIGAGKKPMRDWQAAVRLWKRNAAPAALFDPAKAKYTAAMRTRRQDEQYLAEYRERLSALRSWQGQPNCPYGDVGEEIRRLLSKARDNFGAAFVDRLLGKGSA